MNTQTDRAKEIFLDALEIGDAGERLAFLDRACGGDAAVRREVEELLAHHGRVGSFLATVPRDPNASPDAIDTGSFSDTAAEVPGAWLGPYRLLELLGEGGMGVVFAAEQSEPVRRRVALKLIKPGMDSRAVVARFEAERQALALMDHPNIAKVLDGGATPDGRPFFVMELVRGATITTYCDENHLTVRERLGLFVQVCAAVQHAHQKGVIHRDIKPSNVLVTELDGKPAAKVIDFGIAKAIGQQLTDKTIYTRFMQLIGTPLYMSPEQAGLSGQDVDTRTDVYALGVMLYELLTGSTPFDRERMRTAGFDELRRIIREEEPAKPSSRLSTLQAAATTVSANRGTDPRRLARLVRGELDWVVMKALEKDRNRRYESAAAFADDVQRYLRGEAVAAVPPSAGYRLRKFARRNTVLVGATSALATGLLLVIALLATGMVLIKEESDAKEAALETAKNEKAAKAEEVEKTKAALRDVQEQQKKVEIQKNLGLLKLHVAQSAARESLNLIANNGPLRAADFQDLRKELLRKSISFLLILAREHELERESGPETHELSAEAGSDLARLYNEIGLKKEAVEESQKAQEIYRRLAKDDPQQPRFQRKLARAYHDCANILCDLGRRQEAEPLYKEAITLWQKLIDLYQHAKPDQWAKLTEPPGPAWLRSSKPRNITPGEWEKLARIQNWDHTYDLAAAYVGLGLLCKELGRQPEAVKHNGDALAVLRKLVKDVPEAEEYLELLAQTLNNQGVLLDELNKLPEAEEVYLEAIKIQKQLADKAPLTRLAVATVAVALKIRLLPAHKFPDRPEHQQLLATAHNNLGSVKGRRGLGDGARAEYDKAIAIQEKLVAKFPKVPDYAFELARTHTNRGKLYFNEGKYPAAQKTFRTALDIYGPLIERFSVNHSYVTEFAGCCYSMARCVYKGNPADALPWCDKAIDALKPVLEKEPGQVLARKIYAEALSGRAQILNELDRHADALADYDEALKFDDGKNNAPLRIARAQTLVDVKQYDRAMAEVNAVVGAGVSAPLLFDGATVFAMSARFVGGDAGQARRYNERAVELLRQSIERGFKDLPALAVDPRLDGLRNREDFRELLKKVEDAIRQEPGAAAVYVQLGKLLNGQGRFKGGVEACDKAIAIEGGLAEAHHVRGGALEMLGRLPEAIKAYREAVRLDGNNADARANLGYALGRQGDLDQGIIELEKATQLRPDEASFHNRLGVIVGSRGDLDRAEKAIRRAIELQPRSAVAHCDLGRVLVEKRLMPEAIKAFRAAIERDRNHVDAQRYLCFALVLAGEFEEAKAELKRAHELAGGNPPQRQAVQQLAAVCDRLSALAERLPALLEGEDKPVNVAERASFAEVCLARGHYAMAARLYAEAFYPPARPTPEARFNAARAAARAASDLRLPFGILEKARAAWRDQARGWLLAEMDTWEGQKLTPQLLARVLKSLTLWKGHPDFATVRDKDELARLPEEEQKRWREFWSEVDAAIKQAAPKAEGQPEKK